jgi:hypothetical protein
MNESKKEVYVHPRIMVRRVVMEECLLAPVSITKDVSIKQEDSWGTEEKAKPTEDNLWVSY